MRGRRECGIMKHQARGGKIMRERGTRGDTARHNIAPVYDGNSRVLILGSFPSVASRASGFFYGHPQNRFWRVIAAVCGEEVPRTVGEKTALLLAHGIALYDVIGQCEIRGSADASVRDVTVNDLSPIFRAAEIRRIYVNGKTAEKYYLRYMQPVTGRPCVCLPSTSAANAAWSEARLTDAWRCILGDADGGETPAPHSP